jgi:hypothetical protein
MKKLSAKQIDKLVEQAYYARCSGIQINVMDIGKVFQVGRGAYAESILMDEVARKDYIESEVRKFVEVIRKN